MTSDCHGWLLHGVMFMIYRLLVIVRAAKSSTINSMTAKDKQKA